MGKLHSQPRKHEKGRAQPEEYPKKPQVLEAVEPVERPRGKTKLASDEGPGAYRNHGDTAQSKRECDALAAMQCQLPQTPPLPQHGSKEPAEQKEDRHAETVNRIQGNPIHEGGRVRMLDRPRIGNQEEKRVNHNAQEHRHGAQGIQFVETRACGTGGWLRGVATKCNRRGFRQS